jgi:hypothetical protein
VDTANFVGYVLWSLWLIVFAAVLLVRSRRRSAVAVPAADSGIIPAPRPSAPSDVRN